MTHLPIPVVNFDDLFAADPVLRALVRHWIDSGRRPGIEERLHRMGQIAAEATALSATADREGPRLMTHDAEGNRVDRIVYDPAYRELEKVAYGAGIVAVKYDDAFLADHRDVRHLVGFLGGFLFGQTEAGLYCPICMSDGVGRVLERERPDDPIAQDTIRHLAATDRDELWQGAMFLTEIQGGSDVGANAVQARQDGPRWFLSGDKWFCSNVDAEAILVLARMPEHGPETGTRGLGLFLVLRHRPKGNGTTIRIHRLKDKLGVRSMPTGEVTLGDTEALLVGGAGSGFKQMASMLNLSRIYNAVASVAAMRRSTIEALAYGRERQAFGMALDSLPLWRASMADLIAETIGAELLVFETVRQLDAADVGDDTAQTLVRLLTPIIKASSGNQAVFVVSNCMEAIGGNAYVEDHIMPRLLRDAQVLPIWEGTTNVLSLDTLRVLRDPTALAALTARIEAALGKAEASPIVDPGLIDGVRTGLGQLQALAERMARAEDGDAQRAVRGWVHLAARTLSEALVLEAAWVDELSGFMVAAATRLRVRPSWGTPIAGTYSALVDGTEAPLLDGWLDQPVSGQDGTDG